MSAYKVLTQKELKQVEEIERLYALLAWCRPRLRNDAYRQTLDRMIRDGVAVDHTPIVQSQD